MTTTPQTDAASGTEEGPLYRKLLWLTFFRLAIGTVLLVSTAIRSWQIEATDGVEKVLYALVLGIYLASLAFALVLRFRRALTALAYAEIALDLVIAAAVVFVTGGVESIFVFLFLLGVVNGAILKFRRGAIFASLLATALHLASVALAAAPEHALPARDIFVHVSAFLLTAVLASYLAEQLRSTGERLQASESHLAAITVLHEALVQSVASGLLTLDGAGRVTFINRSGEAITGLEKEAVLGEPAERWFGALQAEGRGETDFVNARGERLRIGYTFSPLIDRDGREVGRAVIFQDLTQLRQMEETVQRSERLADLGRLAAGLAHELRNPLASMTGSIELLSSGGSLTDEERKLMAIVLREATRLNQLVSNFLDFARPRPASREPVDLPTLIGETLEVFGNDPTAQRAKIERSLEAAVVLGDPLLLKQVLWNLLLNAAQALDGTPQPTIRVACASAAGAARFSVSDTGVGIPQGDLHKVFTPFYTTKEQGTGLGLATVHRIVETHGGSIDVESTPGRGTCFTVRLPTAG